MTKLIAEIKKYTPFEGMLQEEIDLEKRVTEYERLGASAISIVTAASFRGEKEWVKRARAVTKLPILMKDFIGKPHELEEAKALGADWVLLIVDLLSPDEIEELTFHAWRIGIRPVMEVGSLHSIAKLRYADANDVLINNRDLRTGRVNLMATFDLLPLVGDKYSVTSASGLDTHTKAIRIIQKLSDIDYMLIGRLLMKSTDLEETFRQYNLCPTTTTST